MIRSFIINGREIIVEPNEIVPLRDALNRVIYGETESVVKTNASSMKVRRLVEWS